MGLFVITKESWLYGTEACTQFIRLILSSKNPHRDGVFEWASPLAGAIFVSLESIVTDCYHTSTTDCDHFKQNNT